MLPSETSRGKEASVVDNPSLLVAVVLSRLRLLVYLCGFSLCVTHLVLLCKQHLATPTPITVPFGRLHRLPPLLIRCSHRVVLRQSGW